MFAIGGTDVDAFGNVFELLLEACPGGLRQGVFLHSGDVGLALGNEMRVGSGGGDINGLDPEERVGPRVGSLADAEAISVVKRSPSREA